MYIYYVIFPYLQFCRIVFGVSSSSSSHSSSSRVHVGGIRLRCMWNNNNIMYRKSRGHVSGAFYSSRATIVYIEVTRFFWRVLWGPDIWRVYQLDDAERPRTIGPYFRAELWFRILCILNRYLCMMQRFGIDEYRLYTEGIELFIIFLFIFSFFYRLRLSIRCRPFYKYTSVCVCVCV